MTWNRTKKVKKCGIFTVFMVFWWNWYRKVRKNGPTDVNQTLAQHSECISLLSDRALFSKLALERKIKALKNDKFSYIRFFHLFSWSSPLCPFFLISIARWKPIKSIKLKTKHPSRPVPNFIKILQATFKQSRRIVLVSLFFPNFREKREKRKIY